MPSSPAAHRRLASSPRPEDAPAPLPDGMSAREVDVLALVAAGLTNREIGHALHVSPRTVQSHIASAMVKTGTANRTHLAVLAVLSRWVEVSLREPRPTAPVPTDPELSPAAAGPAAPAGDDQVAS